MKITVAVMLDYFLFFMLSVKFLFLIASVGHIITLRSVNPKIKKHEQLMRKASETTEMIFVFGMSIFLIYYFVPTKKHFAINKETAVLLFAYGIVMFLGALKKYHFPTPKILDESSPDDDKNISTNPSSLSK
jgi:uncharacterized membrane protein YgdD (TMEM256/DUF423 family)